MCSNTGDGRNEIIKLTVKQSTQGDSMKYDWNSGEEEQICSLPASIDGWVEILAEAVKHAWA